MKRITVYDTEVQLKHRVQKDGFTLHSGQNIGTRAVYAGKTLPFFSNREMHHWRVTLLCNQKEMTIDFYTGVLKHTVSATDVLFVLQREAWIIIEETENYEDYCYTLGMDPDDSNSHLAYGMVCQQVRNLQTFMGTMVFREFLYDPILQGL